MATAMVALNQRSVGHRVCVGLAGVGVLTFIFGTMFDPQRTWANVLVISFIGVGLGLAGVLLPALFRITGATWSTPVEPVLKTITSLLPVSAGVLLAVLVLRPGLYPWATATEVGEHSASPFQQVWLHDPFFLVRAVIYVSIWLGFTFLLRLATRRQALSALFVVVFAFTFWLASCDWIMSLEPGWASTMFGVYCFAGQFLGGLALATVLVLYSRNNGCASERVRPDQLHDLGKLLFAFSTFWMYIWFCQYMLIWFVNFPEETSYYVRRQEGIWQPLFFVNVVLNWAVPFVVLLPQQSKRDAGILLKICVVLLLGRWLDVYLMVVPAVQGIDPGPGIVDIGLVLGGAGCLGLVLFKALIKAEQFHKENGPVILKTNHE